MAGSKKYPRIQSRPPPLRLVQMSTTKPRPLPKVVAIVRDDKTQKDNAFMKCQDECRRMQNENGKIYEEYKRIRKTLRNGSGAAWPNSGSVNDNKTSQIQPMGQYAIQFLKITAATNETRINGSNSFLCHQDQIYSPVPDTTSCTIRETSIC